MRSGPRHGDPLAFDEIGIKLDSSLSEAYDVMVEPEAGLHRVRNGNGCYRGWCAPSWF